jgi:uncharacterized protein (TIGR00725 family)
VGAHVSRTPGGGAAAERPYRISVVGTGVATGALEQQAYDLGRALGEAGAVVITGGLGGVMAAAARGCREGGGTSVGLLPGGEAEEGNHWTDLPLATGMGEGRNVLVVRAAEAVVAVGGEWGTLSEIALARKIGRPVALLGKPPVEGMALPVAGGPAEAAAWALQAAWRGREKAR